MFKLPIRVYIEDTDAGGIVFYANYLKYFERARTEYVRSLGLQLREGMTNNINYVVHSVDLKYIKPAYLDDQLVIETNISSLGKTYMQFNQVAKNQGDEILANGLIKVACVHLDSGKPRKLDPDLSEALQAELGV